MVSQKCQYAIRAVFELTKRNGHTPVKIGDIADTQAIPPRFLEIILHQLKRGGFVQSRRGATGGYLLARRPQQLKVGEIIRFIEGPLAPVACMTDQSSPNCALSGNCAFIGMWNQVAVAMSDVYDRTSFQDLVENEAADRNKNSGCFIYAI
jgi:Rrf2 family transcriptional regulator, cysteine metabolism repressor